MMELHICTRNNGKVLRKFALGDIGELIVGRDEDCDIRIKSRVVSREHCTIEQDDAGGLVLSDMNSTGGTFLDEKKIDSIRLEDGMEVVVGPAVLKFYDSGL
ncbi:MAG: FHA domain-containing protein [Phycisphaerales bacterium]|jgi:pSer/pThr/pTyr-binding forkhead associated (FHA) protein|nr:FHA domain-containing protein [Phycisphaerales bacterium]|tara:strand:+ start:4895 stop:5200 length:306 start_codon:yes stop_codon:yes gene_type:complete